MRDHRTVKTIVGHLIAAMPGRKHPPRPIEQALGPCVAFSCQDVFARNRMSRIKMRPTVLGFDVEVPGE